MARAPVRRGSNPRRPRVTRRARGRPPKYDRPARPITLTLPEDVLARLGAIDADLGRAIVRVVEHQHARPLGAPRPLAEIARYGNHAVIVVTPVRALHKIAGVQLVPVGNGRALISLASPHSIPELELHLRDALERADVSVAEREALDAVAGILRSARGSRGIRLEERTIIVLESKRRRLA